MTRRKSRHIGKVHEKLKIESLGYGGVGISTLASGKKVLIKGALPDSVVDVRIVKKKRDYLTGHITKVHAVDQKWLDGDLRCPHHMSVYTTNQQSVILNEGSATKGNEGSRKDGASRDSSISSPLHSDSTQNDDIATGEHKHGCGGCKRQAVSYDKQLELKQGIVQEVFQIPPNPPLSPQKMTGQARGEHDLIEGLRISPIIGSPLQFGYRNKIEFSFGKYLRRQRDDEIESHEPSPLTPPNPTSVNSAQALSPLPVTLAKAGEGEEIRGELRSHRDFAVAEHRQMGFHKQGEFSKVVDIDQCYLVSEKMHEIYHRIKSDLKNSDLPVHDAKTHHGLLRHLMIREGVHTGHILVNLSIASKYFQDHPKHKKIRRDVLKKRKQDKKLTESITTFVLSSNNGLADIMRDADTTHEVIWGEGKIYEELRIKKREKRKEKKERQSVILNEMKDLESIDSGEILRSAQNDDLTTLRFAISPASFFQTNTTGAELLFGTAIDMVGSVGGNIIDLYCGGGSIGQVFLGSGIGNTVIGIEVVEAAIQDANYNAKINHLSERCEYYVGKAEKVLKSSREKGSPRPLSAEQAGSGTPLSKGGDSRGEFLVGDDLVIVDPPREGMHPDVVKFLIELKKDHTYRLCYISCNPTTMARDIDLLLASGSFTFTQLQPVDMFPHTHHIECIGVLE